MINDSPDHHASFPRNNLKYPQLLLNTIDSLPYDLLKVFTYLSHPDRLSISLTCRRFNTLVKPQIFNVLHFDGAPVVGLPHSRGIK